MTTENKMSGAKKAMIGTAVAGAIAAGGWAINVKFKLFDSIDMSEKNTSTSSKTMSGGISLEGLDNKGGTINVKTNKDSHDQTTTEGN